MDRQDLRILHTLQQDGRISNQRLAETVNMSTAACWRRVKALEEQGVIQGYAALLNRDSVELGLCAFIHVTLYRHILGSTTTFEQEIVQHEEVQECYSTTGDSDFILRVITRDITSLDNFLQERLLSSPQISHVRSNIALRELKYATAVPLAGL